MAWNDPGNQSDNDSDDRRGGRREHDPWSSGDQGPPDLDEALNRMKSQLNGIFGGSGGGGSAGSGGDLSASTIWLGLLIAVLVWAGFGLYQVDEKERAVILRLGKYHATVEPGLHWNPPIIDQRFTVLVTQEQDYSTRGLMLTQDENIVEVPVSVQYKIPDPRAFVLNVRDPITSLHHATDSAIRHVVGSTLSSDVLSEGRQAMASETQERLQAYLDTYETGIAITLVNILKAEPPTAVKAAFDDVIAAKEDQVRYVNEATAYSNGLIPEARGRAQRILQEAIAYREKVIAEAEGDAERFNQLYEEYAKAEDITRERLYLDTVERVMSNASKVLVDVEGGNNLMYLPLDKIVSQTGAQAGAGGGSTDELVNRVSEEVFQRLQRELQRSRRSEGR